MIDKTRWDRARNRVGWAGRDLAVPPDEQWILHVEGPERSELMLLESLWPPYSGAFSGLAV